MKRIILSLIFLPTLVFAQTPTAFFQTSAVSLEEGSNTEQVTILLSPTAGNNETITLQIDLNGNVQAEDLYTIPEHSNGTLILDVGSGATQVTFNIGAVGGDAAEGNEFTTITITEVSNGLSIGQPASINIGISEPQLALPSLHINELQSLNSSTIADPNGEYDDWIELYNSGAQDIDLAGMYLTNDRNNAYKYEFPFSVMETTIPSGGYKIIWADSTPDQGALHAAFRLQDNEGWAGLYFSGGSAVAVFRLIDSVAYTYQGLEFSSGRQTDGGGPWVDFQFPTPGSSNQTSAVSKTENIVFSVYPNPLQAGSPLKFSAEIRPVKHLRMLGPDGKVILDQIFQNPSSIVETPAGLAPGIYLIQLEGDDFHSTQRILIHP